MLDVIVEVGLIHHPFLKPGRNGGAHDRLHAGFIAGGGCGKILGLVLRNGPDDVDEDGHRKIG